MNNSIVDLKKYFYSKKDVIGQGYSGIAFLIEEKETGEKYVAKITNKICVKAEDQESYVREVEIHLKCNYPTVLKIIGFNLLNFDSRPYPTIITEYMINGSLKDILIKNPKEFTMTSKYLVLLGISLGMKYIHSQKVSHVDLKPANILLDQNLYPRITDFGFSEDKQEKGQFKMYKYVGSKFYIAPEIEEGNPYDNSVDVFSFSVIVFELIFGYKENIDFNLIQGIENQKFLKKCNSKNPLERPSFNEICKFFVSKSFRSIFGDIDYNEIEAFFDFMGEDDSDVIFLHSEMLFENDQEKSIQYLCKAAMKENVDAMIKYAEILEKGFCVEKNLEKAFLFYKKAADLGNVDAMYKYATILNENNNSKEEASNYFEKSAEKGNINAMLCYASMLYDGDGIQMDKKRAANYYKNAADLGNVYAMLKYASMLDKGDDVNINKKEALVYYKKAANEGDLSAMFNYARMLDEGYGVEINKKEAANYYKLAADLGNVDSMFNFAKMLFNGDGIKINKKHAFEYFKKAADNKNIDAILFIAKMFYNGDGIEMNKNEAALYFKKAADLGNPESMFLYGEMLKKGDGIEVDKEKAVNYFKKSADNGNVDAMFNYSVLLYNGDGVEENVKESYHYCRMALDKGKNEVKPFFIKLMYEFENEIIEQNEEEEINETVTSTDNVVYKLIKKCQTAMIIQSPKFKKEVVIPSHISYKSINYFITRIHKQAFSSTIIESLSFADDSYLTTIEDYAFKDSQISKLSLPASLIKLSKRWCEKAKNLSEIDINENNEFLKNKNGFLISKSKEILFAPKNFEGDFLVPKEIKLIGNSSFYQHKNIRSFVSKNSSLKSIGHYSFYKCENLQTVVIEQPESEIRIGKNCFSESQKLLSVEINCKILHLFNESFKNCSSLNSISFKNVGNIKIGANSFKGCSNLECISLKNAKKIIIGDNCFEDAINLKTIVFEADFIEFGSNFLNSCPQISYFKIQSNNEINILTNIFIYCENLENVSLISKSEIKLSKNCFSQKRKLKFIEIICNKLVLEENCFNGCLSLETIKIESEQDISLSSKNIDAVSSLKKISVKSNLSLKMMTNFLNNAKNLEKIKISGKTVIISVNCFKNCSSLTNFSIRKSGDVQIGAGQFVGCRQLSKIRIEMSKLNENGKIPHVEFGQNCFSGAINLKQVIINGGNIKISNKCFSECSLLAYLLLYDVENVTIDKSINCKSLEQVEIHSNAIVELISGCFCEAEKLDSIDLVGKNIIIGHGCFTKCSSLKIFSIIKSGDIKIGDNQFMNCLQLNKIVIESTNENITKTSPQIEFGQNCFSGAKNLKEVSIKGGNIEIGKYCFKNCSNLVSLFFNNVESLTIENDQFKCFDSLSVFIVTSKSKVSLGQNCFYGSKNLLDVSIQCRKVSLGSFCFYDCSLLKNLSFNDVYELSIDKSAFYKCNGLSKVDFNEISRLSIGEYGFYGTNLEKVELNGEKIKIENECFKNCMKMSSLSIVSADEVEFGSKAFENCKNIENVKICSRLEFKAGNCCFLKAFSLKSVNIMSNKISIGDSCFKNCSKLEYVSAPIANEITAYKNSFNGVSSNIKYDFNNSVNKTII